MPVATVLLEDAYCCRPLLQVRNRPSPRASTPVRSLTSAAGSCSAMLTVCVAPHFMAGASLDGAMSRATTAAGDLAAAPAIMPNPIEPQPARSETRQSATGSSGDISA